MLIEQIGAIAGKIWDELDQNGEKSLAQLKKKIDTTPLLLQAGIGWLAREEKIRFSKKGNSVIVGLK
ncbi:winged helix-turn-helix domain-containing protein [bacterium]|nr:winged helix-turn-helix domain-containing protein [bacterium]